MNAEIQKQIAAPFSHLVGQNRIIANRVLTHTAFAMGDNSPSSWLVAGAAGLGKTAILKADLEARAVAVGIRYEREAETFFLRSPQDVRLAGDAYFDFISHVQNGDGQSIDEIHEIDVSPTVQTRKLKAVLKGLLDNGGGSKARTVRLDDDTTISRPAHEIYFSAGTNFPERIKDGAAIISRFGGQTELALYSSDELTQILLVMAKAAGLRIAENTVSLISKCGRGTARPLESIIAHLSRVAVTAGKDTINRAETLDTLRALELFPLGLSGREVSMLVRSKGAGISARMLPIIYAIEPKAANQSVSFLASQTPAFVTVRAGLVTLTSAGAAYLDQLAAEKFTIPA